MLLGERGSPGRKKRAVANTEGEKVFFRRDVKGGGLVLGCSSAMNR